MTEQVGAAEERGNRRIWAIWTWDSGRLGIEPKGPRELTIVVPEQRALQAEAARDELREALGKVRAYCPNQPTSHPADAAFDRIIDVARAALSHHPPKGEGPDG